MGKARVLVAAEALNSITQCLKATQTELRRLFRQSFSFEHISRIIDLGLPADDFVRRIRGMGSDISIGEESPSSCVAESRLW